MNNELNRLATYTKLPENSTIGPLTLARSGFFYCGQEDEVECFSCKLRLSNWQRSENPNERHRNCSPLCKLVLKTDVENRPLKSPRPILDVADASALATDNAEVEELGVLKTLLKTACRRANANAVFIHYNVDRSKPDYELLCKEEARLSTFYDWPSVAHADPRVLAQEGLFYTGSDDRVQCVFCRGYLRNWEPADVPAAEHQRLFPNCPFVLRQNVGNVPSRRVDTVAVDVLGSGLCGKENEQRSTGEILRPERNVSYIGQLARDDLPKYPQYSDISHRIRSFEGGQIAPGRTAEELAEAGWFYVGPHDKVRCFQCGGNLRDWEPEDDPWDEHRRWYSNCPYIKTHRPPTRPQALEPHRPVPAAVATGMYRIEPREVKARMDTPTVRAIFEMGYSKDLIRTAIETRLTTTGDDFPNAESLLDAIFKLEKPDSNLLSASRLVPEAAATLTLPSTSTMENSSILGDNEHQSLASSVTSGLSHLSLVPESSRVPESSESSASAAGDAVALPEPQGQGDADAQLKPKGKRKRNRRKKSGASAENNSISVDMGAEPVEGQNAEGAANVEENLKFGEFFDDETQHYLEENRQLREARLCKVCMDADVDTVFLPCGHLVCCHQCSPKLQNCPICRNFIRGTVKTFLS